MVYKFLDFKIIPIADESLGVRSMCIYLETPEATILLDAGVSLGPRRYGLRPHPEEFRVLRKLRDKIIQYSQKADIITISHYHYDHYTPSFRSWYEWTNEDTYKQIYENKIVLAKHPKNKINYNQSKRAYVFLKNIENIVKNLILIDDNEYSVGELRIKGLKPVPHGSEGTKLGFVVIYSITYKDIKLLFAPDVQGPISTNTLNLILSEKPDLLIIGGPPLYLAGQKISLSDVTKGLDNLNTLISKIDKIIVSHHILRSKDWSEYINRKVITYADLLNQEKTLLEAYRDELYNADPPSEEYMKWLNSDRKNPPPIE